MADPARAPATYQDVLDAPPHVVAELVHGTLVTLPRPATPHAHAATVLGEELGPPFRRGRNGPGGWILLDEPEIHLGNDVLVPDLAGWKRTTLPELPDVPFLSIPPDWLCEVLSPSTARHDKRIKMPIYASHGVRHVWLVDPHLQTLDVFANDAGKYHLLGSYAESSMIRAVPFDAVEPDLGALWQR
jgi:Uma2 family endonuclease